MSWKKCAKIWPKKLSESTRWLKQEVPKLICLHVASVKRRTVRIPRYVAIETVHFPSSKLKSCTSKHCQRKVLITKWTFSKILTNYKIHGDSWIYLDVFTRRMFFINLLKIVFKSKLSIYIAWNASFFAILFFC